MFELPDSTITALADGRELAYTTFGDPDGVPVVAMHGTPGSRLTFALTHEAATEVGVRLIAPDRPGYGHSTFHPGRTLRGWARDVAALANHLEVDRFGVIGVSGGGPHALAVTHELPERVISTSVVAGVGPISQGAPTEDAMATNKAMFALAKRGARFVRPLAAIGTAAARRAPDKAFDMMAKQLPPADQVILSRPAVRLALAEEFRLSPSTVNKANAQDFALLVRDWGFALTNIEGHVHFWQGTADVNVPPSHAPFQASLVKHSTLHTFPDLGHLFIYDHAGDMLRAAIGTLDDDGKTGSAGKT